MNNGETLRNLRKITMSKAAVDTISGSQRLLQALSALQHRNYRLYWLGQLSSVLAQNMEGVAQSWLVLELSDSPLLLGLTGLTFAAPTIVEPKPAIPKALPSTTFAVLRATPPSVNSSSIVRGTSPP